MRSADTHWENRAAEPAESYGRFLDNRFRYYSPDVGRYISQEPIGQQGSINLYTYAANHPLNFFDPDGLRLSWVEALARYSAPSLSPVGSSTASSSGVVQKSFADVDRGQQPADFTGFAAAVSNAAPGTFTAVNLSQVFNDPLSPAGRTTLLLQGILYKDPCGAFTFQGSVSAAPDPFDFDPTPPGSATPRHPIAEFSTQVGSHIPGKPFTFQFSGGRRVTVSGP